MALVTNSARMAIMYSVSAAVLSEAVMCVDHHRLVSSLLFSGRIHTSRGLVLTVHTTWGLVLCAHTTRGLVLTAHTARGLMLTAHTTRGLVLTVHTTRGLVLTVHTTRNLVLTAGTRSICTYIYILLKLTSVGAINKAIEYIMQYLNTLCNILIHYAIS